MVLTSITMESAETFHATTYIQLTRLCCPKYWENQVGGRCYTCDLNAYLCQCTVLNTAGIFPSIFTIKFDLTVTF